MSRFYVYPNISMELCSESETIQPNELPYPAVINFRVHVLHFFFDIFGPMWLIELP